VPDDIELDNVMVSQECVGEVRSYANVVWGTTKGSSYVTDTDACYQTSVDDYPRQPIVNGRM
jgi:hypothetical protein